VGNSIICRGLTRTFDGFAAVDGLDLAVPEKSIFGFLGPNGAGKTTTIKMLTGLIEPSAGVATVAGVDARDQSLQSRNRLGYLPENPYFYGWMTGEEFLNFVGSIFGLRGEELKGRVNTLLAEVGLEEARKRRISGYSRGMKQRLGMAQALINEPSVVFLDEPCSALDPLGRIEILKMIETLGKEATVFMSTHILSDADRICDTVAVLNQGRLVTQSSMADLRKEYALPVVRVEFDRQPSTFRAQVEALGWVEAIDSTSPRSFTVRVSDLDKAKGVLPRLAASDAATLVRYELTSPSLEEIFVRMVKG
jgi:ABC-2 type transport system ATP-binding protein